MSVTLVKTATVTDQYCDRCPATAKVQARHLGHKLNIFFCGHHGREHGPALVDQKFVLIAVTHTSEV